MLKTPASELGINIEQIEKLLAEYRGLPLHTYYDANFYEFELRTVFDNAWQYLCPVSSLSKPGDVVTDTIGRTPVIVTHDENGQIHGMINSCRHRGYRVVEKNTSAAKILRCPYHSWCYDLTGKLVRAIGSEEDSSFDSDCFGLLPVKVETWGQAVFVNPSIQAPSLKHYFPHLDDWSQNYAFDTRVDQYTSYLHHEVEFSGNWKLWWDNGTECYHCPSIHGESFNQIYLTSPEEHVFVADDKMLTATFKPKQGKTETLSAGDYRSMHLLPGFQTVQQADFMLLSKMVPTGPESCRFVIDYLAEKDADPERVDRWIDIWQQTYQEDLEVLGVQQKNLRIPGAQPFRYLPDREGPSIHVLRQHWLMMKMGLQDDIQDHTLSTK